MKRLGLTLLFSALITLLAASVAMGAVRRIDFAGYLAEPNAAITSDRPSNARLAFLNEALYPDSVVVSDGYAAWSGSRLQILNEAVAPDSLWTDHIVIIDADSWRIT